MYRDRQQGEQPLTSYIVAHPVRSKYSEILDMEADLMMSSMLLNSGLGNPGEGREMFIEKRESASRMSALQVAIVSGYFEAKDFVKVYPEYSQFNVHQMLMSELKGFEFEDYLGMLLERRIAIKAICERNNWFEAEREQHVIHVDQTEYEEMSKVWKADRDRKIGEANAKLASGTAPIQAQG